MTTVSTQKPGPDVHTPLQLAARGWWQVLKRTYREAKADNLGLIAAGVAFYGFLAMVPTLAALVLLYGLAVTPQTLSAHMEVLTDFVPDDAAALIADQLRTAIAAGDAQSGLGLVLALGLALFGATKGTGAVMTAINIVYEEQETRGLVRVTVVRLGLTLGLVVVALFVIGFATLAASVAQMAARWHPLMSATVTGLYWVLMAAIVSAAIAVLYRLAPDRADARWSWVTPGALFSTAAVVVATVGFSLYSASIGKFDATYGALGAVVALLTWLYFSAYGVLIGAELNAELEHQTASDTTTGPEQPLGRRRAVMADTVAAEATGGQTR